MKIGIIGCGYWGPNLIRNFNAIKGVEVAYCADLNEGRIDHIKELYPRISITKDYTKILGRNDIEAVVVSTPIDTHYKIAMDVLDVDKHVLVEKPITNSSANAIKLIKAAEKHKKLLMVEHTFEYSPPVRKIKEIVSSGELGRIFTINMVRVNLGLFQERVNVIWDLAPHDVSMLLYYLECMPLAVRATGQSYIREGIEDDAHLSLIFKDKITANIHVSWLDPMKIRRTSIVGNKKMLVFDDVLQDEKIKIYDKGVTIQKNNIPKQPYYDTYNEWVLTYRSGDVNIPKIDGKEPLSIMASHFIDCIKNNKKPLTDGYCGLKVVKVLEAAQKSLKSDGEMVEL